MKKRERKLLKQERRRLKRALQVAVCRLGNIHFEQGKLARVMMMAIDSPEDFGPGTLHILARCVRRTLCAEDQAEAKIRDIQMEAIAFETQFQF